MNWAYLLFAAGCLLTLHILVGYPLLLARIPWKPGPPIRKQLTHRETVTVILAVYNGEAFIRAKLQSILGLDYPKELMQILVVSDGSTDGTNAIVREYADRGVSLLIVPHRGKSAAVNRALEHASGDILFFTDVRQPLDVMALRHLVANFADPAVGAVTGEMRLFPGRGGEQADMDLYWRYERWARTVHSQIDSIFASTGCIMAIRRNLVPPIPEDTLSDDAIVPLRAFLKGYRVVYDPAAIATDYPAETSTEFRRRCRNLAGLWQVFVRLPALLGWNNRMWFHFMSHKFGRLLLPWSLLLQVLAGFAFPPSPVRTALLGAELLFVLLLLADLLVPERSRLKRFTSPARTFLTMNAASVAAMRVFFVSPTKLWIPTRVETRANE